MTATTTASTGATAATRATAAAAGNTCAGLASRLAAAWRCRRAERREARLRRALARLPAPVLRDLGLQHDAPPALPADWRHRL